MAAINVIDYATLAVSTGAVDLIDDGSPALPAAANRVYITCETQDVRWRADGTAPTSTEGHTLAKDDSISFTSGNYRQFLETVEFIATSAGDGKLKLTYFD